jgi:hypothetical protein
MTTFNLQTAEVDGKSLDSFLRRVGSRFDLDFLEPILAAPALEDFIPNNQQSVTQSSGIYVRREMVDVFTELVRPDRKQRQVLIGSPGVGKSLLLFVVALYRAFCEEKSVLYIRKTKTSQELTSVFFMTKKDDKLEIRYNRTLSEDWTVGNLMEKVLEECAAIPPQESRVKVLEDKVLLFLDGLHEGDAELRGPHHYLATSGGHDSIVGESAIKATLVVLGGWQKAPLGMALDLTSNVLTRKKIPAATEAAATQDDMAMLAPDAGVKLLTEEELDAAYTHEALEDIFFHAGGRIREAFLYAKDMDTWRCEKKAVIDKMSKAQVVLSLIETKGSGDPKSPDRIRTMFRNDDHYFGSALQIVDSQYFVRLLQDRVELDQYYNAYVHAKNRGLSSAAGCHFEELLHRVFQYLPKPIEGLVQSTGTGPEGVSELSKYSLYWIPSIPNFANIDAALALKNADGSTTVWCIQYTVAKDHSFNGNTFLVKFLRPVLRALGLKLENVSFKIYFVVPQDVYQVFKSPKEVEEAGYEAKTAFVDCSTPEAVWNVFEALEFIAQPVSFFADEPNTKKAAR